MSRHDPLVRLRHMRDFARKAVELTRNKERSDLDNDEVLRLGSRTSWSLLARRPAKCHLRFRTNFLKSLGGRSSACAIGSFTATILWTKTFFGERCA